MPWVVTELGADGTVLRTIDVDEALLHVFAELTGGTTDDMIGTSFPLDEARYAVLRRRFDLEPGWPDADWFLEDTCKGPWPPASGSKGGSGTWFVMGFEKEGDALTHELDLDVALRDLVARLHGADPTTLTSGPTPLNEAVVRLLGEMLGEDFDPARAGYVLEFEGPWFDPPSAG